jgi:hypothetical protein
MWRNVSIAKTTAVWQWKIPMVWLALLLTARWRVMVHRMWGKLSVHSALSYCICYNMPWNCRSWHSVSTRMAASSTVTVRLKQIRHGTINTTLLQICNWTSLKIQSDVQRLRYGLDSPGFEPRSEEFSPLLVHTASGGHPASSSMGTVILCGGRGETGACSWPLTSSNAEFKNVWSCTSTPLFLHMIGHGQLYLFLPLF